MNCSHLKLKCSVGVLKKQDLHSDQIFRILSNLLQLLQNCLVKLFKKNSLADILFYSYKNFVVLKNKKETSHNDHLAIAGAGC